MEFFNNCNKCSYPYRKHQLVFILMHFSEGEDYGCCYSWYTRTLRNWCVSKRWCDLSCHISNPETSRTTSTEHPFGLLHNPETYKIALVLKRGRIREYFSFLTPENFTTWLCFVGSWHTQSAFPVPLSNCSKLFLHAISL